MIERTGLDSLKMDPAAEQRDSGKAYPTMGFNELGKCS
jgi:hypothetical protein